MLSVVTLSVFLPSLISSSAVWADPVPGHRPRRITSSQLFFMVMRVPPLCGLWRAILPENADPHANELDLPDPLWQPLVDVTPRDGGLASARFPHAGGSTLLYSSS